MSGVHSQVVGRFLMEQGLVPKNCTNVEILMDSSTGVIVRYEIRLMPEDLEKFAMAFQATADLAKKRQTVHGQ